MALVPCARCGQPFYASCHDASCIDALCPLCEYDESPSADDGGEAFVPLDSVIEYTGRLLAVERPPQGMAFEVYILSSGKGRFVLKIGKTPERVAELEDETRILEALQAYASLVPRPVGATHDDGVGAFLYTCIEGETLLATLSRASTEERYALVGDYARTLRRLHAWTPQLPRTEDWLAETLARVEQYILSAAPGLLVAGTNSRFDGQSARLLLAELREWRPSNATEIAWGHGDYCLPNVLVYDGHVTGIIDWSRGGYADRRFDLATALFSMNLVEGLHDPSYAAAFLRAYGYTEPRETLRSFEILHALTCLPYTGRQ